jgi:hypothetical protein
VRRVEQYWKIDKFRQTTVYREQVSADGTGQYTIEPLELVEPVVTPSELAVWLALQQSREGFLFRYRDLAVRDVPTFARNYSLLRLGTSAIVAGRDCEELVVQRRTNAKSLYTLAVDRETGLVLRCREETVEGALLGLMEFESIDFAPAFVPAPPWHNASNDEVALPAGPAGTQLLGFEPLLPDTDGDKFVLLETTKLTSLHPSGSGTITWAKAVLTDGLEVVVFLHAGADPNPPADDVMRVSPSVGPWSHVEGTLHGERVMAIGRVSAPDLLDLMESAL